MNVIGTSPFNMEERNQELWIISEKTVPGSGLYFKAKWQKSNNFHGLWVLKRGSFPTNTIHPNVRRK